jgi:hypothetical protein
MSSTNTVCIYCLLAAITLCFLPASTSLVKETQLDLEGDFDWALGQLRSEVTVKREMPDCVGFSQGTDVEFNSEGEPFTIIPLTLTAKKTGMLDSIIPELFLVRNDTVYRICLGVRFLEPKPSKLMEGFHPPFNGNVWPGHAGDRLQIQKGEKIVIELLFEHLYLNRSTEVLMMTSLAKLPKQNLHELHNQPLTTPEEQRESGLNRLSVPEPERNEGSGIEANKEGLQADAHSPK